MNIANMPMTLWQMIAIVAEFFKDKTDKGWEPYIMHCIRVMQKLWDVSDELKMIAIAHDLIEDSDWERTVDRLKEEYNCPEEVLWWLRALTHQEEEKYEDYIVRISETSHAAILVKLADLEDNSNITRLKWVTQKDIERMKKYHLAYTFLKTKK